MHHVPLSMSPNGKHTLCSIGQAKRRIMKEFLHLSMNISKSLETNNPENLIYPRIIDANLHYDSIMDWNVKYQLSPNNDVRFRVQFPDEYPLKMPQFFMICNSHLELSIVVSFVQSFVTACMLANELDRSSECFSPPIVQVNELSLEVEMNNLLLSSRIPPPSFSCPINQTESLLHMIAQKITNCILPKLAANAHLPPSTHTSFIISPCPTPVPLHPANHHHFLLRSSSSNNNHLFFENHSSSSQGINRNNNVSNRGFLLRRRENDVEYQQTVFNDEDSLLYRNNNIIMHDDSNDNEEICMASPSGTKRRRLYVGATTFPTSPI